MLLPSITTREAEQALAVLSDLGLLVRDSNGKLIQNEPLVTTGDDGPLGHHIATFHCTMMQRACEAIDAVDREEREIAALTLSLTASQAKLTKQRLYELRQELLQLTNDGARGQDSERVYQVNFQMFPLSCLNQGNKTL